MAIARKKMTNGRTRYYVVRMIDGRRIWHPGSFATEREARAADAKLTVARSRGQDIRPRRETVGVMIDSWLAAKRTSERHRERTQDLYRVVLRSRVPEALLKMRASDVRTSDVQAVIDKLAERKLSPASILKTHRVLSAALAFAVRTGELAANPCANVELPEAHRGELHIPTGEQVGRILSASNGHPLHPVLVTLAYTGLRRGEALALAWDDVDLDARMLTIRRASTFSGQAVSFERPKTENANRRVPLHPAVVEVLRAHRIEQNRRRLAIGPGWRDTLAEAGGIVFDNGSGEPVHPHRVSLYFRRLVGRLGMEGTRLHDLRHHAASAALNAGVPMLKVSRALGHSRVGTTADLYGHADDLSEATDAVGADIAWGAR